jgi:2-dehydropantoate 2-reductase
MKIMIVGAGVIGTISGWALSNAGHDVIHFVRPGRISKYKEGTLIDVLDKRKGHKAQYTEQYSLKLVESVFISERLNNLTVQLYRQCHPEEALFSD